MKTFKTLSIYSAIALAAITSSCKKDDTTTTTPSDPNLISTNTTWKAGTVHELKGRVFVKDGVTLTIEPGVIVKGHAGQGAEASVLIVSRGAKIDAQGTADNPIIFTSVSDKITKPSDVSNLKKSDVGLWGGLILLGKAPISAKDGDVESSIEGIPANDNRGRYGGSNAADNSGILKYVSVRHGGISIGDGNEINGITFGGVGNGTVVENIEVFATTDDGVEMFGGTVNMKNVAIYNQGDDGIDIDQNYSGTVDNFVVVHGDGFATDEGLEIDGPEGATHNKGKFTLKNGTIKSMVAEASSGDFKSKAQGTTVDVAFTHPTEVKIKIGASYTNDCNDAKEDANTHVVDGSLVFDKINFDAHKVYTKSKNDAKTAECPVKDADKAAVKTKMDAVDKNAKGADLSKFDWTQAKKNGAI